MAKLMDSFGAREFLVPAVATVGPEGALACPFCGARKILREFAAWSAVPAEDEAAPTTLQEHQCGDCRRSFWT